jgi:integrase
LSEIQTLEWRYVDLEQKELRLPDSKTGAKTVHVGEAVVVLLEALPRVTGNPYVIVGRRRKRTPSAKKAGQSSRSIDDETDDLAAA